MNKPYFKQLLDTLAKSTKPVTDIVEELKRQHVNKERMLGHVGTPSHRSGLGGMGYTKASHEESKARHINWRK